MTQGTQIFFHKETQVHNHSHSSDFISIVGKKLEDEFQVHNLQDANYAEFGFIGFRETSALLELVAFVNADTLTYEEIVSRREKFFEVTRFLPRRYNLRPGVRNPNGLLCFVFDTGCSDTTKTFIKKQTQISHSASRGGVIVSWILDRKHFDIETHNNPVSYLPPVVILASNVFPGFQWLQTCLREYPPSKDESVSVPPKSQIISDVGTIETSSDRQLKRLRTRKEALNDNLDALYMQLNRTIDSADENRIKRHIQKLEQEYRQIETEVVSFYKGNPEHLRKHMDEINDDLDVLCTQLHHTLNSADQFKIKRQIEYLEQEYQQLEDEINVTL